MADSTVLERSGPDYSIVSVTPPVLNLGVNTHYGLVLEFLPRITS